MWQAFNTFRRITLKICFIAWFVSLAANANASELYEKLNLPQAIEIALHNNLDKQIALQSAAIAESQYQEALSARWPTLTLQGSFQRRDDAPTFVFPSSSIPLGGLSSAISAALGGAPVPSNITVPEQTVKLFDRNTTIASLQLLYPLYTGGKISSIIQQAAIGKDISQEELRKTRLQIVRDVKRYYYAVQLTQGLMEQAHNAYLLLASTSELTKKMYESGSGSVNKLDYYKTQLAVNYAKSVEADFNAKNKAAYAALSHAMGLEWDSQITIDASLDTAQTDSPLMSQLIADANQFNPQIGVLKLAVKAADAKVNEVKSGYLPQIALTAESSHIENNYDQGLTNSTNRNSWTIGVGLTMPLFNGGLTSNQVNTATLQSSQRAQQQKLVEQGIATLIKQLFIEYDAANQQLSISQETSQTAAENLALTTRAFQIGASKPQDVIEANLLNAIVQGNLVRAKHDKLLNMAELQYVIGAESE